MSGLVTVILHAYRWPAAADLARLRQSIAGALSSRFDLVEAREDRRRAVGAAVLVNRAAAQAAGETLLVLEPATRWEPVVLASFLEKSTAGLACLAGAPSRLWAIPREIFTRVGGLDARLWSIAYVEDLAARLALRGIAVTPIQAVGTWHGPDPYPLRADVRDLLDIRNRLVTAFKTCPDRDLGEELGGEAALALMRACRSANLDPSAFSFGARARRTPRPADEIATLVPLLALDAFLADLPALSHERERLQTARIPVAGPAPGRTSAPERTGRRIDVLEGLRRRLLDAGERR